MQNPDLVAQTLATDPSCTGVPLDNENLWDPAIPDLVYPSINGLCARSIRNGAYGYNFQYLGNGRHMVDGADHADAQLSGVSGHR